MHEVFLDSSVIWSFVGPPEFEPYHEPSKRLFHHVGVRRFTSETVDREIRETEKRRTRLYSELIAHVRAKRKPDEFPISQFSRHVAQRARQLLRAFKGKEADIELFRRLQQMDQARIREARSKIDSPLIPASHNPYFQDLLRSVGGLELGDAKVVTDFVFWAGSRIGAILTTVDGGLLESVTARLQVLLDSQAITRPSSSDFVRVDVLIERLGAG